MMPTLEDDLRTVMERMSAVDTAALTRPVERRAEIGARIRRRRRARATVSTAALTLMLVVGGTAATGRPHHRRAAPPATTIGPSAPPAIGPSAPPTMIGNDKNLVSETIVMPTQTAATVDFRPTSWRLVLTASCAAPATQHLWIALNDHFVENVPCRPPSPADDGGSGQTFDEQFWRAHGVRLGQWSTIAATVVDDSYASPTFAIGTSGLATIEIDQAGG